MFTVFSLVLVFGRGLFLCTHNAPDFTPTAFAAAQRVQTGVRMVKGARGALCDFRGGLSVAMTTGGLEIWTPPAPSTCCGGELLDRNMLWCIKLAKQTASFTSLRFQRFSGGFRGFLGWFDMSKRQLRPPIVPAVPQYRCGHVRRATLHDR